jgi:hypothetical protein
MIMLQTMARVVVVVVEIIKARLFSTADRLGA